MPTRESRTHASITIPLSRARSRTSIRLLSPEARSMLIALPFVALPEPHRHAAVSSARRLKTSNVLNEHAQRVDVHEILDRVHWNRAKAARLHGLRQICVEIPATRA